MLAIGACIASTTTKSADGHGWSRDNPNRRKKALKQNQNI
jgi:hypothetical protein